MRRPAGSRVPSPSVGAGPGRTRRAVVLLVWLALVLAGAAVIARTPFSADLSAFLPASPDARQRVLIEQLQSGVASRTLMAGVEGGTGAAQRADISRALGRAMRASGLYEQVQNGDTTDWQDAGTFVFDHRYQLSPDVSAERFAADGLRDAIGDTISMLGTPAGNLMRPLFERDPTGETARVAEVLIPATSPRTEEGVWVSRTAPRALLLATTKASGSDIDAQAAAVARIQAEFDRAVAANAAASAGAGGASATAPRLLLSGAPVFSVQSRDKIKGEAIHLAIVGALVMGALLLAAFASPRALVIAVLPVLTGVVAGTATVGLVFGSVHGLTMGFGSTLIGETVDYAIYYLIQARGAAVPGTGWQRWRDLNWPTVRLGLLTSVVGFAALLFSGFPGLAQLGVFSIAGLVAAAFVTRHGLPMLAPDGATGMGMRHRMAQLAGGIVRVLPRLRLVFVALGIGALGLMAWQGGHLWRANLSSMSPISQAAQDLDASLRADIGASDGGTLVVVQADDVQSALRATEAAGERLDALVGEGQLAGYESVARLLPSEAVQRARLASLPDAATLRARLAEATVDLPLAPSRLEPFVAAVETARAMPPVTRADFTDGTLAPIVRALLFERPGGGWASLIALHTTERFDAAKLAAALAPLPQVQVVDIGRELGSLYDRYLHEAFVQVLLGATAVVVLLGLYLRSLRRLVAVCQPLLLAVILTLGGMAALHVPLGILHLVGLLLIVAVGSNYALFFDQLQVTGRADEDTLASLMLANLTTVVSFGLIAISDIPALSAIGRVVAPGALLALLLSAAFARRAPSIGEGVRVDAVPPVPR
jgi:predicted exporter